MTLAEFIQIDSRLRVGKAKLFTLGKSALPADDEELDQLEKLLKLKLPSSYRQFLKKFGGGDFGSTVVFCTSADSDWYLLRKYNEAKSYLPTDLLPFSDDFAGGVYAFHIEGKTAKDKILYWNTDGGTSETDFNDIFEYLVNQAY
jgi:hypothetical protein